MLLKPSNINPISTIMISFTFLQNEMLLFGNCAKIRINSMDL